MGCHLMSWVVDTIASNNAMLEPIQFLEIYLNGGSGMSRTGTSGDN
jgi:hypothetical protein